jgi:hypothetical protein
VERRIIWALLLVIMGLAGAFATMQAQAPARPPHAASAAPTQYTQSRGERII